MPCNHNCDLWIIGLVKLLKAELRDDKDFLLSLIRPVVREVLESEMDETVGARKGERTTSRQAYAVDYQTVKADAAVDGDIVIVHPGTYYENIGFNGQNIILTRIIHKLRMR